MSATDDRVVVFDTTLRDGELAPGIALSVREKVEVAEQLARLGVDVVEAGFPAMSDGDFDAVRAVASAVPGVTIAALCRSGARDVERAWQAVSQAERPRLHTYISTSPARREHNPRMTVAEVVTETARSVEHARSLCADVEFSAEDATRTELDVLVEVYAAAAESGATTLNVPDTMGCTTPGEFAAIFSELQLRVPGADRVVWSVHCHDDLGLATANSLAALGAGARQVEVCVNGIGPRAGNAALEEVVMALRAHRPRRTSELVTGIETTEIARTSRLVSMLTGYVVAPNKAIVGANAAADGMAVQQRPVLGRDSGPQDFAEALERLGVALDGPSLDHAYRRFKELTERKVALADADLVALATEESPEDMAAADGAAGWRFQWLALAGGTDTRPRATVRLERGSGLAAETVEADGVGDGMVDAACNAVAQAVGVDAALVSFQVAAVTPGTDAVGDVSVQVAVGGRLVNARGVSTDIVEASARAFLHAINKIVAGTLASAHEAADTP